MRAIASGPTFFKPLLIEKSSQEIIWSLDHLSTPFSCRRLSPPSGHIWTRREPCDVWKRLSVFCDETKEFACRKGARRKRERGKVQFPPISIFCSIGCHVLGEERERARQGQEGNWGNQKGTGEHNRVFPPSFYQEKHDPKFFRRLQWGKKQPESILFPMQRGQNDVRILLLNAEFPPVRKNEEERVKNQKKKGSNGAFSRGW